MNQDPGLNISSKKWIWWFLLAFMTSIAFSVLVSEKSVATRITAENGVFILDASSLENEAIALNGQWKFVWDQLAGPFEFPDSAAKVMQLPSVWNGLEHDGDRLPGFGHATFQLKIVLDNAQRKKELALYLPFVHSSYELFVDGYPAEHAGAVGTSLETFIPSARSNLVRIHPKSDTLELTLQVANYAYSAGGIWQSPQFGTEDSIRSYYDRQLAFDMFIMGGLLLMGLYHIALYFLRTSIRSNIYFGLLCLLLALKSMFTGTVFFYTLVPDASYDLCLKMIHVTLFGPVLLFWLFLRELFENEFPRLIGRILGVLVLIGLFIVFTTPTHIYSQLMIPFLITVASSMVFVIRGIYLAVKRKREGSILILAGAFCFLITVLHDAAIDLSVIKNIYLAGAGFFILIFSQALLLAVKFTNSFKHVEKLTREKQEILAAQKQTLEEEVARQTLELREQKTAIEEKNREITDSITYAKRIQSAILPPDKLIKEYLPESFVHYNPKDIVAGDFYWLEATGDIIYFAAADCTGHGVPGAMVSVVCVNGLNRSVREFGLTDPKDILDNTRDLVIREFEKSDQEVKDGMDISLCAYNRKSQQLKWSGANNPLWVIRPNDGDGEPELIEYKPDKQPIGRYDLARPFTSHEINIQPGDTLYLFTDGYPDQFGGTSGKKYKSGKLKRTLTALSSHPIHKQETNLAEDFNQWKGDLEQVDDVCVIGVRI